jgi:hypothetical protein
MNQPVLSPVTGILNEEDVFMDYGEHAGLTVKQVHELDPDFYDALIDQKGSGLYAIKREAHLDGNKTFRLYLNPLAHLDQ